VLDATLNVNDEDRLRARLDGGGEEGQALPRRTGFLKRSAKLGRGALELFDQTLVLFRPPGEVLGDSLTEREDNQQEHDHAGGGPEPVGSSRGDSYRYQRCAEHGQKDELRKQGEPHVPRKREQPASCAILGEPPCPVQWDIRATRPPSVRRTRHPRLSR